MSFHTGKDNLKEDTDMVKDTVLGTIGGIYMVKKANDTAKNKIDTVKSKIKKGKKAAEHIKNVKDRADIRRAFGNGKNPLHIPGGTKSGSFGIKMPRGSSIVGKSRSSILGRKNVIYRSKGGRQISSVYHVRGKMMKTLMKRKIKKTRIKQLRRNGRLARKSMVAGTRGVVKGVKLLGMMAREIVAGMLRVIAATTAVVGPLILICALFVVFIASIFSAESKMAVTLRDAESAGSDNRSELVAGSVKKERKSLTYNEVHQIPWYSSMSPFKGDIGLDRIRGDRGGNCTAYAWGRRCELEGKRTELGASGNACTWYDREVSSGIYKCGQTAKVGAVCCWSYNAEGGNPGHVAVIEKINMDGSIVVSNSAYGSGTGHPVLFYLTTYGSETELKSAYYKFNGYIYMEKIGEGEETVADSPKVEESITGGVD